jgi:hypothetical protein
MLLLLLLTFLAWVQATIQLCKKKMKPKISQIREQKSSKHSAEVPGVVS